VGTGAIEFWCTDLIALFFNVLAFEIKKHFKTPPIITASVLASRHAELCQAHMPAWCTPRQGSGMGMVKKWLHKNTTAAAKCHGC